jgi:hypothetical protein
MAKKNIIVGPHHGDGWQVKSGGAQRAASLHRTQANAISAGRQIAINRKCELIIQGKGGRIRNANSYGNDPCPPKDTKH